MRERKGIRSDGKLPWKANRETENDGVSTLPLVFVASCDSEHCVAKPVKVKLQKGEKERENKFPLL